ncbi:hypothetical protein F4782DRAFT_503161 [Xylaria castorea]|nr:hypothetical protein F4782DRAFT_503161 [Xylaria castorea]
MAAREYFKGPLGNELIDTTDLSWQAKNQYQRTCVVWAQWKSLAQGAPAADFTLKLSVAQFNSHRLFLELWNGTLADSAFLTSIEEFFEDVGQKVEEGVADFGLMGNHVGLFRGRKLTEYEDAIFILFNCEFFYLDSPSRRPGVLEVLHSTRQKAVELMACARLSRHCLSDAIFNRHKVRLGESSAILPLRSSKKDSVFVGATIEPCPWLEAVPVGQRLPYYLWDRSLRRTIKVDQLKHHPEYIAVSHTWGRWRIEACSAQVAGALWRVPRNTKFDVSNLPDILDGIQLPERYVWMDLLCIPQDFSEVSKREIARQATIFKEASVTIMWLHDINSWSSIPMVLEWLCRSFIATNDFGPKTPDIMAGLVNAQESRSIELMRRPPLLPSEMPLYTNLRDVIPLSLSDFNPWFTSLWTLQELCLRPDMLMANSNWDCLHMNGTPISFDELGSVAKMKDQFTTFPSAPFGAHLLLGLLFETGLQAHISSPVVVVGLGSHRYCQERRAEAIMAAAGITDWFETSTDSDRERDLVLGQYPLRFVRELQQKAGAHFFYSRPFDVDLNAIRGSRTPVGSMLPFGPPGSRKSIREAKTADSVFDTSAWTVQPSGSVNLDKVGLVARPKQGPVEDLFGFIIAPDSSRSASIGEVVESLGSLYEWLETYEVSLGQNYAIHLFHENGSSGLLLKELEPNVLLKVGIYRLAGARVIPEVLYKDWVVL